MIQIEKIVKTCDSCPAQWEGITSDNRQIYVRYRWGCLSVRVGPVGNMSEFAAVEGDEILFLDFHDEYHGSMSYKQLIKH